MKRKPNFFIVGAPKCGTTALQTYLGTHPEIFFCKPKEPNYFSFDMPSQRYVTEEENYLGLFKDASKNHVVLGEATTWYLYSQLAISGIYDFNPDSKIVAMVRNPLEMFPSLHKMLWRNFVETEDDLLKAWELEPFRKKDQKISEKRNRDFDVKTLYYSDVCKIGSQIEKLMSIFPKEQVKIILFDDFINDPSKVYRSVLNFLNLADDGRVDFPPVNERVDFKNLHLALMILKFRDAGSYIKRKLGIHKTYNVLHRLNRLNSVKEAKPVLTNEFRNILTNEFKADIEKLSALLGRNLDQWVQKDLVSKE